MRRFSVLAAVVIVAALPILAAQEAHEPVGKVLIIDETEELAVSVQLEALARILIQQGFSIKAVLGFPEEPVEGGPFDLVLVIPEEGRYIWLCVPPAAKGTVKAPEEELRGLRELVERVFGGARELRTPADDLWPFVLSLKLAELGVFGDG